MGKCRDCIHHDVCKDFIDTAFDGFLDDGDEILYDDNDMNGDYCIVTTGIIRIAKRFVEKCPLKAIFRLNFENEEAEAALKEREENEK